jgi:hypothetical protein
MKEHTMINFVLQEPSCPVPTQERMLGLITQAAEQAEQSALESAWVRARGGGCGWQGAGGRVGVLDWGWARGPAS